LFLKKTQPYYAGCGLPTDIIGKYYVGREPQPTQYLFQSTILTGILRR